MEPERKPAWRRAVVTGDAGFIGTHLRRALLTAGTAVPCVDDFLTSTPDSLHRLRAHPRFVHLPEVSWCDGLAETLAWFAARLEASAGVRA